MRYCSVGGILVLVMAFIEDHCMGCVQLRNPRELNIVKDGVEEETVQDCSLPSIDIVGSSNREEVSQCWTDFLQNSESFVS